MPSRLGGLTDPFDDEISTPGTYSHSSTRVKVGQQKLAQARHIFTYQHRTGLFSFIVLGSRFRVLRWDRSGVFVSEKADYVEDATTLVELIVSFILLDDESQGIDPTATMVEKDSEEWRKMEEVAHEAGKLGVPECSHEPGAPPPDDSELLAKLMNVFKLLKKSEADRASATDEVLSVTSASGSTADTPPLPYVATPHGVGMGNTLPFLWAYERQLFETSISGDWPRYKIMIGNDDAFLVGRPIYETSGLFGRGTRGYVAYHVQSNRFVFLKDAWRPSYADVDLEGNVLLTLNEHGVHFVPTLLAHDFVKDQVTEVSQYWINTTKTDGDRKAEAEAEARRKAGEGNSKKRRRKDSRPEKPYTRHYSHYRIAVKEVCLPLDACTTSRQIVLIVGDGIVGAPGP